MSFTRSDKLLPTNQVNCVSPCSTSSVVFVKVLKKKRLRRKEPFAEGKLRFLAAGSPVIELSGKFSYIVFMILKISIHLRAAW